MIYSFLAGNQLNVYLQGFSQFNHDFRLDACAKGFAEYLIVLLPVGFLVLLNNDRVIPVAISAELLFDIHLQNNNEHMHV